MNKSDFGATAALKVGCFNCGSQRGFWAPPSSVPSPPARSRPFHYSALHHRCSAVAPGRRFPQCSPEPCSLFRTGHAGRSWGVDDFRNSQTPTTPESSPSLRVVMVSFSANVWYALYVWCAPGLAGVDVGLLVARRGLQDRTQASPTRVAVCQPRFPVHDSDCCVRRSSPSAQPRGGGKPPTTSRRRGGGRIEPPLRAKPPLLATAPRPTRQRPTQRLGLQRRPRRTCLRWGKCTCMTAPSAALVVPAPDSRERGTSTNSG